MAKGIEPQEEGPFPGGTLKVAGRGPQGGGPPHGGTLILVGKGPIGGGPPHGGTPVLGDSLRDARDICTVIISLFSKINNIFRPTCFSYKETKHMYIIQQKICL